MRVVAFLGAALLLDAPVAAERPPTPDELRHAHAVLDGMWKGLRAIERGEFQASSISKHSRHEYRIAFDGDDRYFLDHSWTEGLSNRVQVVRNDQHYLVTYPNGPRPSIMRLALDDPPKAIGTKPFDPRVAGMVGATPSVMQMSLDAAAQTPHGRLSHGVESLVEVQREGSSLCKLVWEHRDARGRAWIARLWIDEARDFRPVRKESDLRRDGDEAFERVETTSAEWVEVDGVHVPRRWHIGEADDTTVEFQWQTVNKPLAAATFEIARLKTNPNIRVFDRPAGR